MSFSRLSSGTWHKVFGYCFEQNIYLTCVAKGLKLPDLILSLSLLLKTNIGYKTFFSLIM